jgi:subtilase family serine protease
MYLLLACADDTAKVIELSETNNCAASATQVRVGRPDLRVSSVSNPPGAIAPGGAFSVTVTTVNGGTAASTNSTNRYYLSGDAKKDAADILLTGTTSIGILAPTEAVTGSRSVTVPTTTPPGTYRLLVCADDTSAVIELDETNNCAAAASAVDVRLPDLAQMSVSDPPATVVAGATFTVTDSVVNQGAIATSTTSTRYYLSLDAVKNTGDILLTGSRGVSSLAPGATNTGSKTVTVPTMPTGTYYLLACADDTNVAVESREDNNCSVAAMTTRVP